MSRLFCVQSRRSNPMKRLIAITFALSMFVPAVSAAAVSGEAVYQQRCAACHDSGSGRVPPRDELKKLTVSRILRALDFGVMNNISTKLRQEEREAVAAYLGIPGDAGKLPATAYCPVSTVKLSGSGKTQWNGWSPTLANTRFQPADAAGLGFGDVPRLKLKWAYGFEGDIIAFSQPTVLDGNVF